MQIDTILNPGQRGYFLSAPDGGPGGDGGGTHADGDSEGDSGVDSSGGTDNQSVPYSRFKEVNDQVAAYKAVGGSPEEIAEALSNYELLRQGLAAGAFNSDDEPKSTPKPEISSKEAKAIEKLYELVPELRTVREIAKSVAELKADTAHVTQQSLDGLKRQASDRVQDALRNDGYVPAELPTDAGAKEKVLSLAGKLEGMVANEVYGDSKLLARFEAGDMTAIDEGYSRVTNAFGERLTRVERKRLPGLFSSRAGSAKIPMPAELSAEALKKLSPAEQDAALTKHAMAVMHQQLQMKEDGWA